MSIKKLSLINKPGIFPSATPEQSGGGQGLLGKDDLNSYIVI